MDALTSETSFFPMEPTSDMASNLVASLLLVAMPFVPSSFLLLVVRPGAPSSVLAPRNNGLQPKSDGLQPNGSVSVLVFSVFQ